MKLLHLEDDYINIDSITKINLFFHDDIYTIKIKSHNKEYEIGWYREYAIQDSWDAQIWIECFIELLCNIPRNIVSIKDIEKYLYFFEAEVYGNGYFDHEITFHGILIKWIFSGKQICRPHEIREFIKELKQDSEQPKKEEESEKTENPKIIAYMKNGKITKYKRVEEK